MNTLESSRKRWKKRALIFREAYLEADFKNLAYELQLMNYKANGVHQVIQMQNGKLREKLLEVCRERNELRAKLKEQQNENAKNVRCRH